VGGEGKNGRAAGAHKIKTAARLSGVEQEKNRGGRESSENRRMKDSRLEKKGGTENTREKTSIKRALNAGAEGFGG